MWSLPYKEMIGFHMLCILSVVANSADRWLQLTLGFPGGRRRGTMLYFGEMNKAGRRVRVRIQATLLCSPVFWFRCPTLGV
jgi:hypothetical protein